MELPVEGLLGQGIGRYGSAGLADATLNPTTGELRPLRAARIMGGLVYHPNSRLDLYTYGGDEYVGRYAFVSPTGTAAGYGSPLVSYAKCTNELALNSCGGANRNIYSFWLITGLLVFSVFTKPSADPRGLMATVAAMIAVTAMACQFALLRVTVPVAPSTAVMTGNLTNAVLALMDSRSNQPLIEGGNRRLRGALHLLVGFFVGCVVAAAGAMYLGDWAWSLPAALAAVAVALRWGNIKDAIVDN